MAKSTLRKIYHIHHLEVYDFKQIRKVVHLYFQNVLIIPDESFVAIKQYSPFPIPNPQTLGASLLLCLSEFANAKYLIKVEPYDICPFVSGSFYLA